MSNINPSDTEVRKEVSAAEAALRSEVARGRQCVLLQPRFIEETTAALKKRGYLVDPYYKELWPYDEFTSFKYSCMRLCVAKTPSIQ